MVFDFRSTEVIFGLVYCASLRYRSPVAMPDAAFVSLVYRSKRHRALRSIGCVILVYVPYAPLRFATIKFETHDMGYDKFTIL